ncbi:MAG TPA: CvpA family protein [Acidiphilium sp.]|uniref:CvpA family protein n=1 Tax=unclassified Acidiphilium TaxID=2617493 RepID=UPI000BCA04BD|nr:MULTISPECIES: CvpA family protein [unclassified Acidiphilium]OYV55242.1 MAG: colicin V production protein [Acidiphilium sp. 20-67-58]OYV87839.1 MAG: colicin V production protein [Acidiphilium sp. 21-68-69]HQT61765.1 CvpA family protein [Acidiphilium sp.]HQU10497.1 CvpA family protein [Acidiphilium sp.]
MTWADGVGIAIVLLSGLLALARGFVREVLGIGAWIGAGAAAFLLYPDIEPQITGIVGNPKLVLPASVGIVFIVVLIVLSILSAWLGSLVRDSALSGIDRTLGLAFGIVRGGVIVCLAYIGLSIFLQPPEWPAAIRHARFLNYAENGSAFLVAFLPPAYRPHVDNLSPEPSMPSAQPNSAAGVTGPSQ